MQAIGMAPILLDQVGLLECCRALGHKIQLTKEGALMNIVRGRKDRFENLYKQLLCCRTGWGKQTSDLADVGHIGVASFLQQIAKTPNYRQNFFG